MTLTLHALCRSSIRCVSSTCRSCYPSSSAGPDGGVDGTNPRPSERQNLAHLPDGAAVINIARGGLIDLDALTREVRSRRLRCALDVTDPQEPLPVGDPLRTMRGAIVTPHVAGSGRRVREEIADVVMDDLERFFRGQGVKNRVTTSMLDRMT